MEPNYWLQRWQNNEIGFHLGEVNQALLKNFSKLELAPSSKVLVPLCGKTLDLLWLRDQGMKVIGVELSELAVMQFFEQLGIKPELLYLGALKKFSAPSLEIFLGDFFDLTPAMIGPIDAIYDRAALIALPFESRRRYASQLKQITNNAKQLLLSYEYDQRLCAGPPFSVSEEEIKQHYQDCYHILKLATREVEGGIKGLGPSHEKVWLLN